MSDKSIPKWQAWWGAAIASVVVSGAIVAVRYLGMLQTLEWNAYDAFFRLRPQEPIDDRIVIVTIDEEDIRQSGTWPISDGTLATVLENIRDRDPAAIGLSIYRNLPIEPGHDRLVEVFQSTPELIGMEKIAGEDPVDPPPTLKELGQVANADVVEDRDGRIRRALLVAGAKNSNETQEGLATRLSLMYLGKPRPDNPQSLTLTPIKDKQSEYYLGQAHFIPLRRHSAGYGSADTGGYQILLNYRGGIDRFPHISFQDVLADNIPPRLMVDRIVLIGATAPSLNDYFLTPYSYSDRTFYMAGVAVQANIVSQMLSAAIDGRPLLRVWSRWMEWVCIGVGSLVGTLVGWTFRSRRIFCWIVSPLITLTTLIVASGGLIAIAYIAFLMGWWIPLVAPLLSLTGSAIAVIGYVAILEQEERITVMSLFERHVTAKVARAIWSDRHQLLSEGRLVGQKMTATILFTDLKGFTTIAERTDPEVLLRWLNEYMNAMTEAVLEYDGVVDKFIGDAVMAAFGVPIPRTEPEAIAADAQAAIDCALDMGKRLQTLNESWQERGLPTAAMRVGIATGPVVAGSIGGVKRLDYTTIGDTVNVAARLESYDKSLDGGMCRILISEQTHRYVGDRVSTREIGSVELKGRQGTIAVYCVEGNAYSK